MFLNYIFELNPVIVGLFSKGPFNQHKTKKWSVVFICSFQKNLREHFFPPFQHEHDLKPF